MKNSLGNNSANKILVVAPAWIGDILMAQTLFKLLQQNNPRIIIDVLAPAATQPLLQRMPEVTHHFLLDSQHGEFALLKRYQLGKQLRKNNYQQAIVLPNSWKSALAPFFAKIPQRTGWLGEQRYGLLTDYRRLNKHIYPQMIQRFAALAIEKNSVLAKKLPYPHLAISTDNQKILTEKFLLHSDKPILALCPGAEFGPAKRWPAEYYAQVAQQKLQQGWQIWLVGSTKEKNAGEIIQTITQQACVNLIGQTTLSDVIDLLALTNIVVCNDSGLMHIAAAV
ncbi:MAG: lipopolysaccharide heptosyltransferase II, partial [Gammaproteobacteria bacterium]|nr:lipopolysaccharide heptosyltransferase II [Gammaproteobacteria bacterium]